jgi:hypothetical protein
VNKRWIVGLIVVILLASCQSSGPLHQYTKGTLLTTYDFTGAGSFEEGAYGAATLQILDGNYQIDVLQGDNVLWWGQWGDSYTDTVIDVDTQQLSEVNENTYGVMCRVQGNVGQKQPVDPTLAAIMQDTTPEPTAEATEAATAEATEAAATAEATAAAAEATAEATDALVLATPVLTATPQPTPTFISTGDGYLFLVQGSGQFAIMRSRGRNLTPLVNWTNSDAIRQGPSANHLRAICAGNYLAFYVNDQFVGDATDDTYKSGQVGLAASSANRVGTRIVFDNLTISEAAAK